MVTIAEALAGVELEPGKTYRCNVRGLEIELRVAPPESKSLVPDPLNPDDIMLDPVCELPIRTGTVRTIEVTHGDPLMPESPSMFEDGEQPE